MISCIEKICAMRGVKMTPQRRLIARVLADAEDHPDVDEVYRRAHNLDSKISLATVYRAMNIFEGCGAIEKLEIKDNKSRYEPVRDLRGKNHHHHLVDMETGEIIEFCDDALEELKVSIAKKLGYRLMDHRLELYGVKIKR